MRMERLAATMPHSTVRAFRHYAQTHDLDLYMVAKIAVTKYCVKTPASNELMQKEEACERVFISMPDTAMRLLELWSANTGISKTKLIEWAIRQLSENQLNEEE